MSHSGGSEVTIPRAVASAWDLLVSCPSPTSRFDPTGIGELPEAARRLLLHAIAPGTPLWAAAEVHMHGHIRLQKSWLPFIARQVLAPSSGFIWVASTRLRGVPVTGFDRYTGGSGEMRWKLAGLIPVATGRGDDVTVSARGRLVGESILVPTGYQHAQWREGSTADRVVISRTVDDQTEAAELTVDRSGALTSLIMRRWGDPDSSGVYARHPFGVRITREDTIAGITVPTAFSAAWWAGTEREPDGQFFRAEIDTIRYLPLVGGAGGSLGVVPRS